MVNVSINPNNAKDFLSNIVVLTDLPVRLQPRIDLETKRMSKPEFYHQLQRQLSGLLEGEADLIANLANTCALLYHNLTEVNWVGFYRLKEKELVLGPFQGQPACVRIPIGKGVCGTAAAKRETVVVENVHEFDGHIACDAASNSEIVIPLIVNNELIGVLDIDSPQFNRFDSNDREGLEAAVQVLTAALQ